MSSLDPIRGPLHPRRPALLLLLSALLVAPLVSATAPERRGTATSLAPRVVCDPVVQCSGNGKCLPKGSGDLCLCIPFREGNRCETVIPDIEMDFTGGMGSGDVAACVLLFLIGIPALTVCLLGWMEKKDMF